MRDKIASEETDYREDDDVARNSSEEVSVNDDEENNMSIGEINVDDNSAVLSETSDTDILSSLVDQSEYYETLEPEVKTKDSEKTMQSYLKKIFRQVKFLTDSGKNYREPNFIQHVHGQSSQAVELCTYLWGKLGKN